QYKGQFGYIADAHTGAYYCTHRFYDPNSGRWLSRDPVGLEGGTNTYSYCDGNPVMLVDPSGCDSISNEFGRWMEFTWRHLTLGGSKSSYDNSGQFISKRYSQRQPFLLKSLDMTLLMCGIPEVGIGELAAAKAGETVVVSRMANVRSLGQIGESRVASLIKIGPKTRYLNDLEMLRIADGTTKMFYTEIKNVGSLAKTKQITDGIRYAEDNKMIYNLFVRKNTTLSKPLQSLVTQGLIKLYRVFK
ncbi:MAG: RHS repeat-associated core domain-containing protein, partial [Armatimonadota bacterium]